MITLLLAVLEAFSDLKANDIYIGTVVIDLILIITIGLTIVEVAQ